MATTCWNFWFGPSGLVWLGWAGQVVLSLAGLVWKIVTIRPPKPQMKQTNQTEKNPFLPLCGLAEGSQGKSESR